MYKSQNRIIELVLNGNIDKSKNLIFVIKSKILYIIYLCFVLAFESHGQELLTLSKAMSLAAVNSYDLKLSALSLEQSQENLKVQNAALKSDFQLQLDPFDYSNQLKYDDSPGGNGWYNVEQTSSGALFSITQPVLLTDATIGLSNWFKWQNANGDKSYYNNVTLNIDQPLFSHNMQKIALEEVVLEVENAELNYALEKLSLELLITQGFFSVYQKQMQLIIYEDELYNQKRNLTIIKQKIAVGLTPLEEVFQSEVNLVSSETSLETAQVSLANAKDEFKVLLGVPFDFDFLTITSIEIDSISVELKKAIERAMTMKKELRQREIDIDIAEFALLRIVDDNSFRGNLSLQVGLTGQDEALGNIFDKATNNTGIGFSLEVPIWDWGKRKARIRSAKIGLEQQELLLQDDKIDITLTIRKLHRNLSSLYRQILKAERNIENSQLTYDVNLERHKNGDITSMELQLFQNQLSQKKMEHTNAIINYKLELLNMKIQTLYDWEHQKEIVPEELFVIKN